MLYFLDHNAIYFMEHVCKSVLPYSHGDAAATLSQSSPINSVLYVQEFSNNVNRCISEH